MDEKSNIYLPPSYFVESADKRAKKWRETHLKTLDNEHELVVAAAKAIAKSLDKNVMLLLRVL